MGYRLRYVWNIDWIPTGGMGVLDKHNKPTLGGGSTPNAGAPGLSCGGSTTFTYPPGNSINGAISSTDIANITAAAAADVAAQANANIGIMQAWATQNAGVW